MENFPRLVFDEAHSEAWSLSPETARTINPVNPADASYALAAAGARPARATTSTPTPTARSTRDVLRPGDVLVIAHPADRGAERVTGSGSPRLQRRGARPGRGVRPRRRRAGRAGGVRPGQVRQQPAGAARPLRHRDRQHHRAGGRLAGTRTSRPGCSPTSAPPSARACWPAWPRSASTAPACCRLDGAPGAQVLARHQRHRRPGRPAAGRGGAGRTRPGRGLRRLRPVRRRLDRGARPPHPVDQRRHLGRRCRRTGATGRARGQPRRPPRPTPSSSTSTGWRSRTRSPASGRCSPRTARSTAGTHDLAEARRLVARDHRARSPRSRRASRTTPPTSRPSQVDFAALGRRGLRRARLPRLAACLPPRPAPRRRPAAPGRLPDVHPERQPRPQRRGRLVISVVWPQLAGRAGADRTTTRCSCRSPSSTSPPATTPTRRCSSPRPSRCARCPKFTWGAHLLRPRGRPLPPGQHRRRADARPASCPPDAERLVHDQGAGPERLRAVGPDPRPHPQPRRPAVRPVHDQAADAVLDVRAWRSCAATSPPSGRPCGWRSRACPTPGSCSTPSCSTGCSASRSPATGSATTTASAASCSSPTCTGTTSCAGPTTGSASTGSGCRRPSIDLRRRGRGALPRRHRPLPSVAHWLAAYELVSRYVPTAPGSTWAKGTEALPLDGPPEGPDRRGAARRVPAQHVLRGAAQEARRRHRRHLRDHRVSTASAGAPARSPAGSSSWPARPARPGRRWWPGSPPPARPSWPPTPAPSGCEPVVAQGNAAAAGGGTVHAAVVDLLDEQATRDWAAAVLAEFGRVDGLVHLVGGWRGGESFTESDLADWDAAAGPAGPHAAAHLAGLPRQPAGPATTRRLVLISHGPGAGARRRPTPPTPRPRPPPRPGPWRWQTRSRGSRRAPRSILPIKALLTPAMREAKPEAKFTGYTDVADAGRHHPRPVADPGHRAERTPSLPSPTDPRTPLHDPEARGFASDNYAGVHPEVLAAIAAANGGHQVATATDVYTARLQEVFREHFGERRRGLPGLQRHRRQRRRAAGADRPLGGGDLRRVRAHQRRRVRRAGEGRRPQAAHRARPRTASSPPS